MGALLLVAALALARNRPFWVAADCFGWQPLKSTMVVLAHYTIDGNLTDVVDTHLFFDSMHD